MRAMTVAFVILLTGILVWPQQPHPDLAESDRLEASAKASFSKRDYKKAAELLKECLGLREKVLGADHPDVATTLHSLANVYQKAGKSAEAEQAYLRAILIRKAKLGTSSAEFIEVLTDYGCLKKPETDRGTELVRMALMKQAQCLFSGLNENCDSDPTLPDDGILNGKVETWVFPKYPKGSDATQQISVHVIVGAEGDVVKAYAPCGDLLLRKAALAAAWQAKIKPKLINGKPTQVRGVLIYNFVRQ